MNRSAIFAVAIILATGGLALASPQNKKGAPNRAVAAIEDPSSAPGESRTGKAVTSDPAYVIGPGDLLDVSVWKEPDVSRLVPVRPDGKISIPLIDDVQASGQTPLQLSASIAGKLTKFLKEPQVTVIVTQINSQRVFVVGEVTRVGAMALIPGMTVLQALASAGGFTPFADTKKIHVMRTVNGKQVEFSFNYRDVLKGEKPEQNIQLEPGDMIVVP